MTKGEDTKAAILRTALERASRDGFLGLSLGSLAQETGLSKSGLFAHFGSKEDLQLQVLDASVEAFVEHVVAPALRKPRGLPRVRALFDGWLEWSQELSGGCVFLAIASDLDDKSGPVRDKLVAYQRDWSDNLAIAASIAVAEGHFREDLDTRQFAHEFSGVYLAYHHHSRLMRDPEAESRARAAFEGLIQRSSARS
ncbi:TetR family transcriptional regulator [Acidobacteria bacterium Mor1]|nr:TetR family transcriptional regulator [Acidobacteria bacterium Mor1]